jgi:hypothetical protein
MVIAALSAVTIEFYLPIQHLHLTFQRFFTIVHNFFQCLAYDEREWGNRKNIPVFGDAESVWSRNSLARTGNSNMANVHEVKRFYDYWCKFETAKTFEWVKRYEESESPADDRYRCSRHCNA